jgi:hypothetical protein
VFKTFYQLPEKPLKGYKLRVFDPHWRVPHPQLTEKIKKLEKALKKSNKKGQKRHHKDSNLDSE